MPSRLAALPQQSPDEAIGRVCAYATGGRKRRPGKALFIALVWCVLTTPAWVTAQPDIRNPQSAIDSRMRTELRVDPISHALQFQIALGQYAGRAGHSLPVTLNYSSKVWQIKYLNTQQCQDDPGSLYRAEYAKSSAAGWTSNLDWFLWPGDISTETYDQVTTKPATSSTFLKRVARIFVTLPDGSRHELRKDDELHPYNENITGLFYSVDGSRLIYDTTTRTLYLPDGSRYITDYDPTTQVPTAKTYIDSNGNRLSYSYATGQWTDTLGRVFGLPLPDASVVGDHTGLSDQDTPYSLPGVGNTTLNYIFRWRHLSTSGVISEHELDPTLRYKGDHTTNCQSGTNNSGLFHSNSFGFNGILKSSIFDPVVLYQIVLPNGQAYTFKYNNYGEISKIIYPTGGYQRLRYGEAPALSSYIDADSGELTAQGNRGVTNSWISADGVSESHSQYGGFTTYAPDGTRTERTVFRSNGGWVAYGFDDPRAGMVYEERTYSPTNQMLRRKLTDYTVDGQVVQVGSHPQYKTRNPRPNKVVEILLDTGAAALTATTTYQYDADLNPSITRHYDYASVDQTTAQTGTLSQMPLGALLRTDETIYLVNDPGIAQATRAAYRARNLVALSTVARVHQGDVTGPIVAETRLRYDETALASCPNVVSWSDPGTSVRGNGTTVSRWLDTTNSWIETHTGYDHTGNAISMTDALGFTNTVNYTDAFADGEHCPQPGVSICTYAYPTHTLSPVPDPTNVRATNTPLESWTTYDFSTGLVTQSKDANNQITTYDYTDPLSRLKQVNRPDGGRTTYTYVDAHQCGPYIETRTLLDTAGRELDHFQFFDGLGRGVRSFQYEGQEPTNPYLTADTQYDALGRVAKVSNPYRSPGCTAPVNPAGRWTETTYDALSRPVTVKTTTDGAQLLTAYSGNQVTVTDQAGKVRRSVTDALGRLTTVTEAPGVAGYGFVTTYTYDALGNLRQVNQGGQFRYFMYDSLARLVRARNPEQAVNGALATSADPISGNTQWTTAYGYDPNGNLTSRTDARNVTATYLYDNLNRVKQTSYSDATPLTLLTYDFATNGRGRFYADYESSTTGTINYVTAYDAVGRPTTRMTSFYVLGAGWSGGYVATRQYDKAGNVTGQTYPSGHTVTYNYDAAGRLGDYGTNLAFTGNLGDGGGRTYAAGVSYDAGSRTQEERFGTQTPLYHKRHYNARGQLYDIRLSTVPWATDPLNWNRGCLALYYDAGYHWGGTGGPDSGPDNNGNVLRMQNWVPGDDQISSYQLWDDFYSYDALNRLTQVQMNHAGSPTTQQVYQYDRFGNRTIDTSQTTPNAGINNLPFTVDPAGNNHLLAAPGGTLSYDAAGNQSYDNYSTGTAAVSRLFDGEHRLTETRTAGNQPTSVYTYDAGGQRVRRNLSGVVTWQLYGFDGELLAEYAASAAPATPQKEYGYRNGELLVTAEANGSVHWLVPDHLGTPRMLADLSGSLANMQRHDYLPFGEELTWQGGRTTQQGYSQADGVRQRFTSKERDAETGLDYFGARYYASMQGRFISADDFLNDTHIVDPASWNLYTYVRNNPLRYIDPLGQTIEETADKKHKLSKGEKKAIEKDLQAKTGLTSIHFDNSGKLVYNSSEKAQGGSAQLRQAITGAIDDQKNVFQIGDYSGSEDVEFAQADQGVLVQNTGVTTYQVKIDFADFRNAREFSDSQAMAAFSLGLNLYHEIDHKVSYDPSNPLPGGHRPDISPGAGVPGVIDDVNVAQGQLGLVPRDPGAHAGQRYNGVDSRLKKTYYIPFANSTKFLRWQRENSRQ